MLPLTTAVTQVVMIRTGTLSIGVPANVVEIVRRATAKEVQQAYNTGFYELGGDQLPFYWSGALLQASARSTEPQSRRCRWWCSAAPRSASPCTWTKCWATRKWW